VRKVSQRHVLQTAVNSHMTGRVPDCEDSRPDHLNTAPVFRSGYSGSQQREHCQRARAARRRSAKEVTSLPDPGTPQRLMLESSAGWGPPSRPPSRPAPRCGQRRAGAPSVSTSLAASTQNLRSRSPFCAMAPARRAELRDAERPASARQTIRYLPLISAADFVYSSSSSV
jgi:hypothetical protein